MLWLMHGMRKVKDSDLQIKERRVKGNLNGTQILESKNLSKNLCITKTRE